MTDSSAGAGRYFLHYHHATELLTCNRCGFVVAECGNIWQTAGEILAHMNEEHTPHAVDPYRTSVPQKGSK